MVTLVLTRSLIVNAFLSLMKIIAGFWVSSRALIADGIHSLSDFLTDLISIGGVKLANKKEDAKHPYGHGKIEYLLCMGISIIILSLSITLLINSFTTKNTIPHIGVAIVTIVTIFLKFLLSSYILNRGKKYKGDILIASGHESMSDVVSSLVVLASFGLSFVFSYADKIACGIISILIFITGVKILIQNISNILGSQEVNEEIINEVQNNILKNKEVLYLDNFKLLKYGSYYKCEVNIYLDGKLTVAKANNLVEKIKKDIIINYEKIKYVDIYVKALKKSRKEK